MSNVFMRECKGDVKVAASLMSNFLAQRWARPLIFREIKTPFERFGNNVAETLKAIKKSKLAMVTNTPTDILRRSLVVSGAAGPLAPDTVYTCVILLVLFCLIWAYT